MVGYKTHLYMSIKKAFKLFLIIRSICKKYNNLVFRPPQYLFNPINCRYIYHILHPHLHYDYNPLSPNHWTNTIRDQILFQSILIRPSKLDQHALHSVQCWKASDFCKCSMEYLKYQNGLFKNLNRGRTCTIIVKEKEQWQTMVSKTLFRKQTIVHHNPD